MNSRHILLVGAWLAGAVGAAEPVVRFDHVPAAAEWQAQPLSCWSEARKLPRPLRIHVARFDLQAKDYELATFCREDPDGPGPGETVLEKPEVLLTRNHGLLAVNANAFRNPITPGDHAWTRGKLVDIRGFVAASGAKVSPTEASRTAFWLDPDGKPQLGQPAPDAAIRVGVADWNSLDSKQPGRLLSAGKITIAAKADRHPRTALGFDAAGRWLTLMVVDGRQQGYSEGVSLAELAGLLQEAGCAEAINLDGGGSSIMIIAAPDGTKTLNRPSDKAHRPIATLLGIRRKPATP